MKKEKSNIKKAFHFYNLNGILFNGYIKTNETSKIPCFYLESKGSEPLQIMIEKAEYCDENTENLLCESDLFILDDVLMSESRFASEMTNWEYIVKLWNDYNENKISTENLEMPFYNHLKTCDVIYFDEDDKNNVFIETGFNKLDEALGGGFKRGDLVLLASRPCVEKSSFALNIFKNCAIDKNLKGVYFALGIESAGEVKQRLLSQLSGIDIKNIIDYSFSKNDYDLITSAREIIERKNIKIDWKFFLMQIAWKLIDLKEERGLDFVIIDGLQQIKHNRSFYSEITYVLKRLAKKLNITVILLSQLPRTIEERKNHRPKLQDLSAYDAIEEDCDIVMLLYNPDNYAKNIEDRKDIIELDVAKTSQGKKKTLNFKFDRSILKFSSID